MMNEEQELNEVLNNEKPTSTVGFPVEKDGGIPIPPAAPSSTGCPEAGPSVAAWVNRQHHFLERFKKWRQNPSLGIRPESPGPAPLPSPASGTMNVDWMQTYVFFKHAWDLWHELHGK